MKRSFGKGLGLVWLSLLLVVVLAACGDNSKPSAISTNIDSGSQAGAQTAPQVSKEQIQSYKVSGQAVNTVKYSPDGQVLAFGGDDKTVLLQEAASGKEIAKLIGFSSEVKALSFSPDGKAVAVAAKDQVKAFDTANGKEIATWKAPFELLTLTYSPDGKSVVVAGFGSKLVFLDAATWQAQSGPEIAVVGPIYAVAYSPNGKLLATGGRSAVVDIWDAESGKSLKKLLGHGSDIWAVAFSSDNRTVASGGLDAAVYIWDAVDGKELASFEKEHTNLVTSVAFSPDGKLLATGSTDRSLKVWDVQKRSVVKTLTGNPRGVNAVAFSPNGKQVASASGSLGTSRNGLNEGTIAIWSVQ